MPEPVFIALEGLRGCGKSTIAPLLARRLGARHLHTLPPAYCEPRRLLDTTSRNAQARAHLFLSGLLITADQARALLDDGISVVIDSFLARTVATHRAYGAQVQLPPAGWPEPISILLECGASERAARLHSRLKRASWWDELAERRAERIETEYRALVTHRLDTTGKQPHECVEDIIGLLRHQGVLAG